MTRIVRRARRHAARLVADRISPLAHWGLAVTCPCCGGRFRGFLPFIGTTVPIPGVECPRCHSHHRHRLLSLYFDAHPEFLRPRTEVQRTRLLHLAPEPIIARRLASAPGVQYVSADLSDRKARVRTDLTALAFRSDSFDAIVAIHVLEHIPDDSSAIREIRRVLKPGGWAILQVPLDVSRAATYEDPRICSAEEREREFGQRDHVRLYGNDYRARLEGGGFLVDVDRFVRSLGADDQRRFGLDPEEDIYVCRKLGGRLESPPRP